MLTRTCMVVLIAAAPGVAAAREPVFTDARGDAIVRRTDPGNDGSLNPLATLPDVIEVRIDDWQPTDPIGDPYTGSVYTGSNPSLVRVEVVFDGLVCPPGPLGLGGEPYDPFRFGPSPVLGYLDIDADDRKDTGGELGGAAQNRYLANVGRFGAMPESSLGERTALSGSDLDSDFFSTPQYERSGADFAISLCGCFSPAIVFEDGDIDGVFDAGETWILRGRFFERTKGYALASAAYGGSDDGFYDPEVDIRFVHDIPADETTITLVFPLTMAGAAALTGEPEQPVDLDVSNHVSVEEAVQDIIDGAPWAPQPTKTLTDDWQGRDPAEATDIQKWSVTALFGTAYVQPEPSLYAWTDHGFGALVGDLNGDGYISGHDRSDFDAELSLLDGGPDDGDGSVNGSVAIVGFAQNFNMADFDGNGTIDAADRAWIDVCVADMTTQNAPFGDPAYGVPDGLVTAADIQFYVNLWITNDARADVTTQNAPLGDPAYGVPDGLVTAADIQLYVNSWIAGCP